MKYTYDIILLKTILLLLPILLLYLFLQYMPEKNKKDLFRYKIKCFYLNWLLVLLYVLGYFEFLFVLRLQYIHQISDLKLMYHKTKALIYRNNLLDLCYMGLFFILSLSVIVYVFYLIHQFFIAEVIKRFLIIHYFCNHDFLEKFTIISIPNKVFKMFYTLLKPFQSYLKPSYFKKLFHFISYLTNFMLYLLPVLGLALFFLHELLYNNCILSKNFYAYLLFYFIYSIYKRITNYLCNSEPFMAKMVYEMYYKEGAIMYANIPDKWENIIYDFVENGLYRDPKINHVPEIDDYIMGPFETEIKTNYRWESKDCRFYYNKSHMSIEETASLRRDVLIHKHKWLKKYYKRLKKLLYCDSTLFEK